MTSDASLADQTFFQGFSNPTQNWSRLPNALIDALPLVETLAELKVILYVLRHTWGYREYEQARRITLDEFMNGRKDGKGKRLDHGVGMAKTNIISGIRRAVKHGFMVEAVDGKDKARVKKYYHLSMYQNDTSEDDGQVYRNDTTDVSKQYTEGIKSIHRTKNKETKERNSTKKDSAQPANAVAPAGDPAQSVEPETKRESTQPVKDEVLSKSKNLPPGAETGKLYLHLDGTRYQGPYAPYSEKRPAGTYFAAETLPPGAIIVPPPPPAPKPKAPRPAQPYDVLFDAIGEHIFGAKDAAGRAAVAGRIAPILHGDKKGGRCIGIIGYECMRQSRETNELDYNALADDVGTFWSWFKANNRDITIADCAKVLDYWQKWRNATKGQNDKWTYDPMTGWKEPTHAK